MHNFEKGQHYIYMTMKELRIEKPVGWMVILDGYDGKQHYNLGYLYYQEYEKRKRIQEKTQKTEPKIKG